jgi:glycosyltransferase involved in cell wall biosynthesis
LEQKKRILYFYTHFSSFVAKDVRILEPGFIITKRSFAPSKKIFTPFLLLSQFLFILLRIGRCDLVICQFGGYHSYFPTLLAKIFRKPSLIITGGMDCVSFPSIHYGVFNNRFMKWFTVRSYKNATHISPVHESLMLCDYTYQDDDFKKQGLLAFAPFIKTPFTVIYNGYDPEKWKCTQEKKPGTFITVVSGIEIPSRKKLKGIDLVIQLAKNLPGCSFTIIGIPEGFHLGDMPPNIATLPFVKNEELPSYYSRSEFYLQLSMSEGFPNALCEAMLCECIPIVSNVGAMPDIVNDSGFILRRRDLQLLKKLAEEALATKNKEELRKKARERIAVNFPESRRKTELLKLTLSLTGSK